MQLFKEFFGSGLSILTFSDFLKADIPNNK